MSQSDIIRYFVKNGNKPVYFEDIKIPHLPMPTIKRNLYKMTKHNEIIITKYPYGRTFRSKYNLHEKVLNSILKGR